MGIRRYQLHYTSDVWYRSIILNNLIALDLYNDSKVSAEQTTTLDVIVMQKNIVEPRKK